MRLTSADLPTFGRPTIASTGSAGQVDDRVGVVADGVEDAEVVVVEQVVAETLAQRVGALSGLGVVDARDALGEPGVELGEVVVLVVGRSWSSVLWVSIRPLRRRYSTAVCAHQIHDSLNGLVEVEFGGIDDGDTICGVHEVDDRQILGIPGTELCSSRLG